MKNMQDWKTKTLLIGAGVGLLVGVLSAYIIIQNAESQNTRPEIKAGDGVKVGLGVLGVMRLLGDIGNK